MNGLLADMGKLVQIGIIVRDVEKTAETYEKIMGVKRTITVQPGENDTETWRYHGKPTNAISKNIAFRLENIELEFIQPMSGGSDWYDFLKENGEGIHHIAFEVKNIKEKTEMLEKEGYEIIQKGEFTGGRFIYFDTKKEMKTVIELLEFDAE